MTGSSTAPGGAADAGADRPAESELPADPPTVAAPSNESQPAASQPAAGRAGRNLPMAIGVGVLLGAIVIVSLVFARQGFVAVIAIVLAAGVWEMRTTLARARGIAVVWAPLLVGVVAAVVTAWPWGHRAQILALAGTALAVLIGRLPGGAQGYLADVTATTFLAVYLGGFGSFATMLVHPADGAHRVLVFLIAVVCSDVGGYAAGVLAGRHPLAPTISPKKSWEGLTGSLALAAAGAAISLTLLLHHPWWQGAVIGVVVALVATCGDLVESLIKRDLGVKDMGHLLPGHGGVMDRLDSLLPSALVSWVLLAAFVPAR